MQGKEPGDDIVLSIATKTGISQKEIRQAISALTSYIGDRLLAGSNVRIYQLGTFVPVLRPQSPGRNMKTGEPMVVPPLHSMRFKPSAALLNRLRNEQ